MNEVLAVIAFAVMLIAPAIVAAFFSKSSEAGAE